MAIARPVTRTIVSTTDWGIPVTDEVNRLTAWQQAQVPTVWWNVVFANGWSNYSFYVTQYRKVGDMVQIRGGAQGGVLTSPMFTLPAGFRPPGVLQYVQPSWGLVGVVQVNTDGTVVCQSTMDNRFAGVTLSYSTTA